MKYGNWKIIGIDKDGKEHDITEQFSDFLHNQIEEEISFVE